MPTCVYVTVLDRECGRQATSGEHCGFHAVLAQLDAYRPGDGNLFELLDRLETTR